MNDYIQFELNNRKVKIHRENSEDIWIYYQYHGKKLIKNPRWRVFNLPTDKAGYKLCRVGKKQFKHHRVVYYAHNQDWDIHDSSQLNFIDHIDQTTNNNHISNLRVATKQQNNWNMKNVKGYYWKKSHKRYQAFINLNHKPIYLGLHNTKEEAHQAYLDAKKIYHKW